MNTEQYTVSISLTSVTDTDRFVADKLCGIELLDKLVWWSKGVEINSIPTVYYVKGNFPQHVVCKLNVPVTSSTLSKLPEPPHKRAVPVAVHIYV